MEIERFSNEDYLACLIKHGTPTNAMFDQLMPRYVVLHDEQDEETGEFNKGSRMFVSYPDIKNVFIYKGLIHLLYNKGFVVLVTSSNGNPFLYKVCRKIVAELNEH